MYTVTHTSWGVREMRAVSAKRGKSGGSREEEKEEGDFEVEQLRMIALSGLA